MSEFPDRDPLDALVPALHAGTDEASVKAFVVHWRTVLNKATKRPCPLCYTKGGWGDLRPVPGRDDILYKCLMCTVRFGLDGSISQSSGPSM
jgi:hypothetical protein